MKTAAEFRELLPLGAVHIVDELLDALAAREEQLERLVEAGKAALGDLGGIGHDNGLFDLGYMIVEDYPELKEKVYAEKERIESELRAAIAAVEGEAKP